MVPSMPSLKMHLMPPLEFTVHTNIPISFWWASLIGSRSKKQDLSTNF